MAVPVIENWVQSDTGGDSTGSTLVMTAPSGIAANELLMIIVGNDDAIAADEFTTVPSGWTRDGEGGGTTADTHIAVFYKVASGSEGNVTITANSNKEMMGWYLRISGVDTTSPINVSAYGQGGNTSNRNIPGVTTTVDDCLVLYALMFDGGDGDPFSVSGTGWTETDEGQSGGGAVDLSGCFGSRSLATAGASGTATVSSSVSDGSSYLQIAVAPSSGDALLADDIESSSEVSSPSIGQEHALNASDVQSTSVVSSPSLGQEHALLANDVQSTSQVSAPTLSESHALLANDVESASEVGSPSIGQTHALTATSAESSSEVSAPALGQTHGLLANDVESSSEVGSPAVGQVHALSAVSVESASEVSAPSLTSASSVHNLLADDIESASEVSAPTLSENVVQAPTPAGGGGRDHRRSSGGKIKDRHEIRDSLQKLFDGPTRKVRQVARRIEKEAPKLRPEDIEVLAKGIAEPIKPSQAEALAVRLQEIVARREAQLKASEQLRIQDEDAALLLLMAA